MKNDKIYFENLDSIRFIAATMVFLGHGLSDSYKYLPNNSLKNFLDLISSGATGVSIFFVLSGFLITYLLILELELNSKINIKNFYIRRVLRIWPLYFAIGIISFIIYNSPEALIGIGDRIFYSLSFLSNFVKCFYSGILMPEAVTWSVSIEEQFYLFWPLLFLFLPHKFWLPAILFTIICSIVFRVFNFNDATILYFHSLSVLLDLGIGGLFAYLIKTQNKFKSFFENTATKSHFVFFLISVCLLYWNVKIFDFKYGHAIGRIFISTSFACIICAQAITKSNSILNLKNFSFANKWGKYTYGIYLIHPIALTIIGLIAEAINFQKVNTINAFIIAAVGYILTLFISKLSYTFYESRFLKLKYKFATIKTHE
ncbi:MAG: acyltransferase [Bacteroidota bacterium]